MNRTYSQVRHNISIKLDLGLGTFSCLYNVHRAQVRRTTKITIWESGIVELRKISMTPKNFPPRPPPLSLSLFFRENKTRKKILTERFGSGKAQ